MGRYTRVPSNIKLVPKGGSVGRSKEDLYDALIEDFEQDRAEWDRSKGVPAWVVLPKDVGGKRPETLRLMLNQRLGKRRYEVKVSVKKVSQTDLDGDNSAAYAGYKAGDTAVLFFERTEDDPYVPETGKGKGAKRRPKTPKQTEGE